MILGRNGARRVFQIVNDRCFANRVSQFAGSITNSLFPVMVVKQLPPAARKNFSMMAASRSSFAFRHSCTLSDNPLVAPPRLSPAL